MTNLRDELAPTTSNALRQVRRPAPSRPSSHDGAVDVCCRLGRQSSDGCCRRKGRRRRGASLHALVCHLELKRWPGSTVRVVPLVRRPSLGRSATVQRAPRPMPGRWDGRWRQSCERAHRVRVEATAPLGDGSAGQAATRHPRLARGRVLNEGRDMTTPDRKCNARIRFLHLVWQIHSLDWAFLRTWSSSAAHGQSADRRVYAVVTHWSRA